jgi:antitoxin VapB
VPLNIRNEEVNRLAIRLAAVKRTTKTEAILHALQAELRRLAHASPLRERLRPLQEEVARLPSTGADADIDFYDSLSRDP